MPTIRNPAGIQESDDVEHDQTEGGTEGNPHVDSAASGDVSPIQSSGDVDHDNTSGGTSGNPHGGSASTNHGNGAHSANFETDSGAQSRVDSHENKNNPHSSSADTNHGNEAHSANFETNSGAQSRVDSHENKNNPHSSSADTNHGNEAHSANFETNSGAQSRVDSHENKNNPHSNSAAADTVREWELLFDSPPAGQTFIDIPSPWAYDRIEVRFAMEPDTSNSNGYGVRFRGPSSSDQRPAVLYESRGSASNPGLVGGSFRGEVITDPSRRGVIFAGEAQGRRDEFEYDTLEDVSPGYGKLLIQKDLFNQQNVFQVSNFSTIHFIEIYGLVL